MHEASKGLSGHHWSDRSGASLGDRQGRAPAAARGMRIFFSAGEPSGDLHGANLIRHLRAARPGVEAVGFGGPEMASAGCQLVADLTALAVMWFARVLANIRRFLSLLGEAERYFRDQRPDAVVLIDFPGFNWWVARKAKKYGIPVYYYCPPQIWAWAQWRVKKMRRLVDHILCALPFEETWFRQHGCQATFVGHPFFDEVDRQQVDETFMAEQRQPKGPLVAILPGSRTQEVTHNFRWFVKAAALVRQAVPNVRFAVAAFKPHQAELCRKALEDVPLPIEVYTGKTPELIRLADCCMAVSGSVSLELLAQVKPTVILYWVTRPAFFVQSFFRKVKYITLVNLLNADELYPKDITLYNPRQPDADRVLFPEYLTCADQSRQIATHVIQWLTDAKARARRVADLTRLRERVSASGASAKAAAFLLAAIDVHQAKVAGPHFSVAQNARIS